MVRYEVGRAGSADRKETDELKERIRRLEEKLALGKDSGAVTPTMLPVPPAALTPATAGMPMPEDAGEAKGRKAKRGRDGEKGRSKEQDKGEKDKVGEQDSGNGVNGRERDGDEAMVDDARSA